MGAGLFIFCQLQSFKTTFTEVFFSQAGLDPPWENQDCVSPQGQEEDPQQEEVGHIG